MLEFYNQKHTFDIIIYIYLQCFAFNSKSVMVKIRVGIISYKNNIFLIPLLLKQSILQKHNYMTKQAHCQHAYCNFKCKNQTPVKVSIINISKHKYMKISEQIMRVQVSANRIRANKTISTNRCVLSTCPNH